MTRTFGIELETVPQLHREVGFRARLVGALRAAGFNPADTGYSGADYTRWQVKSDSSIGIKRNGRRYDGAEVVSPVLPATEAGFNEVAHVCHLIEDAGATANVTCGMHVHVDIRDLTVDQVRNVLMAYAEHQAEIDSVLPRSRRGSRWARPLWASHTRDYVVARLQAATTVQELAWAIGTRYSVLNLQKFTRTGTLEFRQHSGTAEASKATAWAQWCVAFVETHKDGTPAAAGTAEAPVRTLQGRGACRTSSRGISRALIDAMATPMAPEALQALIYAHGGTYTTEQWMHQLAARYGRTVAQLADGRWVLAEGLAPAPAADPFARCFGCGDLAYFGRRRRQLAR